MENIVIYRLLLLVEALFLVSAQYDCPSQWETLRDKCYKFVLAPSSLKDAEAFCDSNGAALVSVNSREEHLLIYRWLDANDRLKNKDWFTSGRMEEGTNPDLPKYRWEGDGTQIEGYQFWLPDGRTIPPDGGKRILYNNNGRQWGWKLGSDSIARPFICEISKGDVFRIVEEERSFTYGMPEVAANLIEKGPKIEVQPQSVIYNPDSVSKIVTFQCQATGNPYPDYEWWKYKDSVWNKVQLEDRSTYTITGGSLVISKPDNTRDNGDYQCKASNKFGTVLSTQVSLNFGYLNDFPKSTREPVSVEDHMYTALECNPPKHYPAILYAWYKDSILNFVRTKIKPHMFISRDGKLYFSSVTQDDEGDYYCLVQNPQATVTQSAGKTSLPIPLHVTEGAASIREPKIVNGFPQVFPSAPKHGDTVYMECIAWGTYDQGMDTLGYTWRKVGGAIPARAKFEDHSRVLVIPNVEGVHEGTYECTARRKNGLSDSNTLILSIEAVPYFIIELKDQHIDLGSSLTMRCVADGKPEVQYSWYINGTLFDPNSKKNQGRVIANGNVMSINETREEDSGMYQCGARNRLGIRYSTAQVRVISLAPTFAKFPVQPKVYATLGGSVTMRCTPESAPKAEKTWSKNGVRLNVQIADTGHTVGRIAQLPNGNLVISKITKADEGVYQCNAKNSLGEASSKGNVTVLRTSKITYAPEVTEVSVNKTAFLHCEASYDRKLDLTYNWYHNGRYVIFERFETYTEKVLVIPDKHFARGTGIYRGGLYIYKVQFMHAGVYECVAVTTSDEVKSMARLIVKGPPSPPSGVYGENVGVHTITLFWTSGMDHGSDITSYQIEAYSERSKVWKVMKDDAVHSRNVDQRQTAKLDNLSPFNEYKFRVRARNALGLGEPSMPSTSSYTTGEAIPERAPTEVGGGGGKVGDLTITWTPVSPEYHNGRGMGYRVYWKKKYLTEEDWDERTLHGPDHDKLVVLVGSNNFYSEYSVRVQVFNRMGDGPPSPTVNIMSAEDLPAAVPLNVRAAKINASAIMVEWDPVPQTREAIKGILRGYRINYWKEEGEIETMALYKIVHWDTDHGMIIGLANKTYYYINVQVYNHAGFGPKSEWYLEETWRNPPLEAPQEVHVYPHDHYSVDVKFRGVETGIIEEPLQGYMVRTWLEGESIYAAQEVDCEKKTRMILRGLESNKLYNLRVFGYSLGGEGRMSSPTVQFVLGSDCQINKEYPDKTYLYMCDACNTQISILLCLTVSLLHVLFTV